MPRVKLFDENEVLIKAMNLFWKQGYSATSVQDLVSHLGINRASIYDTFGFGDKNKLFKKSFELYRKQNSEGLIHFFESRPNVKKGFSELFDNAIQEAVSDKDRKQDFINIFFEYLKTGQESGQLKSSKDLKSLATLFYTLYNGIRVVSKIRPNKKELTDSINVALSLLV